MPLSDTRPPYFAHPALYSFATIPLIAYSLCPRNRLTTYRPPTDKYFPPLQLWPTTFVSLLATMRSLCGIKSARPAPPPAGFYSSQRNSSLHRLSVLGSPVCVGNKARPSRPSVMLLRPLSTRHACASCVSCFVSSHQCSSYVHHAFLGPSASRPLYYYYSSTYASVRSCSL
jgi:hypothetical protein